MAGTVTVVGDGPTAALHALAAEDAGLQRVASGGEILVVAASAGERVGLALVGLERGARVLVDPPLSVAELDQLVEADGGRQLLGLADHRRFAPAWLTAVRLTPSGSDHVSVLVSRPAGDGEGEDPVMVLGPSALAAAEALAGPARSVSVQRDGTSATVAVDMEGGATASLRLELGAEVAVWHAQAAGPEHVVAVELVPEPLVERNGEPVPVPRRHQTRDDRLEHLGYIDQVLAVAAGAGAEVREDLRRLRILSA